MSLKDNFYQAMKEMLNTGGLVGSDLQEKAKGQSELDSYLETPAAMPGVEVPPYQQQRQQAQPQSPYAPRAEDARAEGRRTGYEGTATQAGYDRYPDGRSETARNEAGMAPTPYYRGAGVGDMNYEPPAETTIISKNTLVEGNIRSFANITVQGNVRGDISVTKDALLSGKVIGALKCNNLEMNGSALQGDVNIKGRAAVDSDSMLLGDMQAQCAEVNGKVKGNMNISGKAEFLSDAVILGDIRTSAITVMDGANIQGFIDTTFLRENAETVFPGNISIGEEGFATDVAQ